MIAAVSSTFASGLPASSIVHARPRLGRWQMAVLQQFDGDAVRRFDKGHVPITRRAVDNVARIQNTLARVVNVVDAIGQVAEIAPAGVRLCRSAIFRWPVIGELYLGDALTAGGSKKDERKAPLLAGKPADFFKPDQLEERNGSVRVGHTDHGMEKFGHERALSVQNQFIDIIAQLIAAPKPLGEDDAPRR